MTTKTITNAVARDEIYYPESDGEPLGETGFHANVMYYAFGALTEWFRERDDAYVAMDMFIYYVMGDPARVVAPDIFVVLGAVGTHVRRVWQTWREGGAAPSFVLELVSQTTWRNDAGNKRDLYARLGVGEYWRHDPEGNLPVPALVGERLVNGRYEPIEVAADESGILRGYSPILGLDICVREDGELTLYDPARQEWRLSMDRRAAARLMASEAARQVEAEARQEAEAEIRRLRELLGQGG